MAENKQFRERGKIKKTVCIVLFAAALLYLGCLIFSTVLVFRMQELTYTAWGWGVVLAEYKLDFNNDFAERNYYDFDGTLSSHVEETFSKEQQTKIMFACAVSFMPFWKSEYIDPHVADGDQWEITMNDGKKEKSVYGYNAYPFAYRRVYHSIQSVFPERHKRIYITASGDFYGNQLQRTI